MTDYDFSTLNDKEFERLVNDLLAEHEGVLVERFKAGKDQGIDGRFYSSDNGVTIIQSKHYLKSGLSKLKQVIKNTEVDKVKKLSPERYILATSVELSALNKSEFTQTLAPFVQRADDVLGRDELNSLLDKYQNVEKNHFKLWLSSSNIIELILHKHIHDRSHDFLSSIKEKSRFYALTNDCVIAQGILNDQKVLIAAGEPGAGKTTLAEIICLSEASNGYSIHVVRDIVEAEKVFSKEETEKQLFFFDDFLGSTYLEALNDNKDSHIVQFISRIKRSKNRKLVLTSRTAILMRGLQMSDHFLHGRIAQNEYLIEVKAMSRIDKATILYNHIWHGDLSEDYIDQIYLDDRYLNIIDHRNFNPRIIQFITMSERLGTTEPEHYFSFAKRNLDNPEEIWRNYFDEQMNEFQRVLVDLVVFNRGAIKERILKASFDALASHIRSTNNIAIHRSITYERIAEVAVGSVLNREISTRGVSLSTFNPSINDYVLAKHKDSPEHIYLIISSLGTTKSLLGLWDLNQTSKLSDSCYRDIVLRFVGDSEVFPFDYQLEVAYLASKLLPNDQIEKFENNLIDRMLNDLSVRPLLNQVTIDRLIGLLTRVIKDIDVSVEGNKISEMCYWKLAQGSLDNDELIDLSNFIDEEKVAVSKDFCIAFCKAVVEENEEWVRDEVIYSIDINPSDLFSWSEGGYIDDGVVESEVINFVESGVLSEYAVDDIEKKADISISGLIYELIEDEDVYSKCFDRLIDQTGGKSSASPSPITINPRVTVDVGQDTIQDLFER